MNVLEQNYPIELVNSADYNPRAIKEEAFELLKYSLNKFGIVKPLILNGHNRTLTAGHQRTKASKAIGLKSVPVMIIEKAIPLNDEIRFNLLHNSIETNSSKIVIKGYENLPLGYSWIDSQDIEIINKGDARMVKEISSLLLKYGEWGSVVMSDEGEIVQNSDYAYAVKLLDLKLLVYKMPATMVAEYMDICTNNEFGEYSFDSLNIKAYNQLYCQMNRIPDDETKRKRRSRLYEMLALKNLDINDTIVDFGAGKCHYINMLKANNYKAFAYEPHYKVKDGFDGFDIKEIVRMIYRIEKQVRENGLFDKVILDSVLNSVTNPQFEDYVLTTCNALLHKDGTIFVATRDMSSITGGLGETSNRCTTTKWRQTEYLDKNNFSATFRNGIWTMQKFHTQETLHDLLSRYFEEVHIFKEGTALLSYCRKPKQLPMSHYKNALDTEFNMEYPNDYRHNKHEKLVATLLKAIEERHK